jgi:hypothetical protein
MSRRDFSDSLYYRVNHRVHLGGRDFGGSPEILAGGIFSDSLYYRVNHEVNHRVHLGGRDFGGSPEILDGRDFFRQSVL